MNSVCHFADEIFRFGAKKISESFDSNFTQVSYFETTRRVLLNSSETFKLICADAEKEFFYPKANVSGRIKTQKN